MEGETKDDEAVEAEVEKLEQQMEADAELRKRMDERLEMQIPGNAVEGMENAPDEVKAMREDRAQMQAEFDQLKQETDESFQDWAKDDWWHRTGPGGDGLAGLGDVAERYAYAHGPEPEQKREELKAELEPKFERMGELQDQMAELDERILEARRRQHNWPRDNPWPTG